MKRGIPEIFTLSLAFIAVICLVTASGVALYCVAAIAHPELTLDAREHCRHRTNETFWRGCDYAAYCAAPRDRERPDAVELTRQRQASYQQALRNERNRGIDGLAQSIAVLALAGIMLALHWLTLRRLENLPDEAAALAPRHALPGALDA